jgi:hypothetical protein
MADNCQRPGLPTGRDSWSHWEPDPERAFDEHDATLEPYALMSREEILECMQDARGGREWEFLTEFLLDKCPRHERRWERIASLLSSYLELGRPEVSFAEAASSATRLIDGESEPAER